MWSSYGPGQPMEAGLGERLLSLTTVLFEQRGRRDVVSLLLDVRSLSYAPTDEVMPGGRDDTGWSYDPETVFILLMEVDADQLPRFTPELVAQVETTLLDVFQRVVQQEQPDGLRYIADTVKYVGARERLPDVAADWRDVLARNLTADEVSNQARRDRLLPDRPTKHGMTFASREELLVYNALVALQERTGEDRTIAIMPLPAARLRAGHVWSPDLVVLGNGRALIFEIDGPHHRAGRRVADDQNRDLQWRRCGVPVVRLPVEDLASPEGLRDRLKEEIARELFRAR